MTFFRNIISSIFFPLHIILHYS